MFPWQKFVRVVFVLTAFFVGAGQVQAQLPPDQRRQMRQEMREQWRQMPQEDRQRMRDEHRGQWQMPPEDRQRMRDEMRGHSASPPGGGRGGRH
jgi:predicted phage gp36 major capsid-like protein